MTRPVFDRFLGHLGLGREAPKLDYLHRIVREHQLRVPFETFTKLLDYEPGLRRGDFMPPIEAYVERIVTRGAGGLCWTLARGLHALLRDLGFDASLLYMDPGHCCVRVELPEVTRARAQVRMKSPGATRRIPAIPLPGSRAPEPHPCR